MSGSLEVVVVNSCTVPRLAVGEEYYLGQSLVRKRMSGVRYVEVLVLYVGRGKLVRRQSVESVVGKRLRALQRHIRRLVLLYFRKIFVRVGEVPRFACEIVLDGAQVRAAVVRAGDCRYAVAFRAYVVVQQFAYRTAVAFENGLSAVFVQGGCDVVACRRACSTPVS